MSDEGGGFADRRQRIIDGYADRARATAGGRSLDASGLDLATLGTVVVATLVHAVSLAVVLLGVWCCLSESWLLWPIGVLLVVFGLYLAPRPALRRAAGLRRADLPELFALLDRVAACNRAPVPHVVVVDPDFNASASTRRGERALTIGAPLWVAAPPTARVALLGHELGHFAHRDALTGWWTRSAYRSACEWVALIDDQDAWVRIPTFPVRVVLAGVVRLMGLMSASSSRTREYLADLDAITAGGTDGAIAMFDALLTFDAVDAALRRAAFRRDDQVWREVTETLAKDDPALRASRRAEAARERSRVDASHPATIQRIRMIEERDRVHAGVVVDTGGWHRIDAELAPLLDRAGAEAAEQQRYRY